MPIREPVSQVDSQVGMGWKGQSLLLTKALFIGLCSHLRPTFPAYKSFQGVSLVTKGIIKLLGALVSKREDQLFL